MNWALVIPVALLSLLALGLVWLYLFGGRPSYHRHGALGAYEDALRQLAEMMKVGTVYVIEHRDSERFLQFARREDAVRFGFPDAPWSRAYFEPVVRALADAGVPTEVVSTGDAVITRFLHAELQGTAAEVGAGTIKVARLAAAAMGLREEESYRGHYEGGYDPVAYLAYVEPQYERLALEGPGLVRKFYAWHLRTLRRATGRPDHRPPAV